MMKPHFKASDGCDYNPDIALMIWISVETLVYCIHVHVHVCS